MGHLLEGRWVNTDRRMTGQFIRSQSLQMARLGHLEQEGSKQKQAATTSTSLWLVRGPAEL